MTRSLAINATASLLQLVIGALVLFVLYRFIGERLGVEAIGVWSVVMASVSATRLADLGIGASVTRFVARDLARFQPGEAAKATESAVLTLVLLLPLILISAYPLFAALLRDLFKGKNFMDALEILPYAMASMVLNMVASIVQSALDGCQRMDIRASLVISSQAVLLALALWLIPDNGLVGLALAQIGQGVFLALVGWWLLRRQLTTLSIIPLRWSWRRLCEMFSYGAQVQVSGVFLFLYDPVTKVVMARFGGAEAAGYFEIASQMVIKARTLIVAANQAIVPIVAELGEKNEVSELKRLYQKNMQILLFVGTPLFSLLYALLPIASTLLVGDVRKELTEIMAWCILGWWVNIFAGPAYFYNMGSGRVGCNALSHAFMFILNFSLCLFLGAEFGANGVVWAYVIALSIGSGFLIVMHHFHMRVSILHILQRDDFLLFLSCIVLVIACTFSPLRLNFDNWMPIVLVLVSLQAVIFVAWRHPFRAKFWEGLSASVNRRE